MLRTTTAPLSLLSKTAAKIPPRQSQKSQNQPKPSILSDRIFREFREQPQQWSILPTSLAWVPARQHWNHFHAYQKHLNRQRGSCWRQHQHQHHQYQYQQKHVITRKKDKFAVFTTRLKGTNNGDDSNSTTNTTTDPSNTTAVITATRSTATTTTNTNAVIDLRDPPNERAILLNECLDAVLPSINSRDKNDGDHKQDETNTTSKFTRNPSIDLMEASLLSLTDPIRGYDPRYGRPALRTYRSFVYPKEQRKQHHPSLDLDRLQLQAAAKRTANQITFLVKRQASQRMESVRNHDDPRTPSASIDNDPTATSNSTTAGTTFPITLILDNLRGSFNVGSIFRTAEACGVRAVWTTGITPHPNGSGAEKVAKSALGADLLVPTRHFTTTREALETLIVPLESANRKGPLVVALETTSASKRYTSIDYRPYYSKNNEETDDDDISTNDRSTKSMTHRGIALILGNEVTGVDVELLKPLLLREETNFNDSKKDSPSSSSLSSSSASLVDLLVELPTHGKKNSLNVAAVAPVVLYEIIRQWTESE